MHVRTTAILAEATKIGPALIQHFKNASQFYLSIENG